jgi:hypothetical protein
MSKEAMKLALEALESGKNYGFAIYVLRRELAKPDFWEGYVPESVKPAQPVALRLPKVGDEVVCIEDESLGGVVAYLTAGGSPEIRFDDGSHGTYMLREFAELFRYTSPQPAQQEPVAYAKELIEGLYENGDPVSVDAAELLEQLTSPQPAQSKPLTDEHIERIYHRYGGDMINCARAIERAAQQEPVNQRAHEMALRQWDHWKQYALELQEKLVKYEGGSPMVLNNDPQPAQQEPVVGITAIRTWFKDGRVVTQTLCNSWVDTYPQPPQRTWVGLTDADKETPDMGKYVFLSDDWIDGYKTGLEKGEAKLKEKNT